MRRLLRTILDRLFTSLASLSVLLMAAALLIILGPILWRGAGAVVFQGTVEFRELHLREFGHGDSEAVAAEVKAAEQARQPMYDLLNRFARGIDTEDGQSQARHVYRELKTQLGHRVEDGRLTEAREDALRDAGKEIRNALIDAYRADTNDEARRHLAAVLNHPRRGAFDGTVGQTLFDLAQTYQEVVQTVDLGRRAEYAAEYQAVDEIITKLFGPAPGEEPAADLAQFRYGATRLDRARKLVGDLRWKETWVPVGPGQPLQKKLVDREEIFAGTALAGLFDLVERDLPRTLRPRQTIYWRYFTDGGPPGNLFGGVGRPLAGTLLLALFAMLFSVPIGIVTAGYLVECTREGRLIRFIRMCINTLAGVPSIVFGLFGLAFFVLWFLPKFGLPKDISILAGSLTLGVLVLPIIIRASEEAIRAVPGSYKEASLALGAGAFRTFVVVTLPAALPGILTGIILAVSRAAGETAPILFTAAVAYRPDIPDSIFSGGTEALSYGAYVFATADNLASIAPHNQYGMTMTLILLVLLLNVTAILIRSRMSKKLRG